MNGPQDTLYELYSAQQEEIAATNLAIEQLTADHIQALGTGADATALQATQALAGFGAGVEGSYWNGFVSDLAQARVLIVESFQDYNAAASDGNNSALEMQATDERYASVNDFQAAVADANLGYQAGSEYLASNPQPVSGDGTPSNPLQGGLTETFAPNSTVTLDGGTQVQVDTGGGPPQEAGVDWNTWYSNWINQVNQQVFQPLTAQFAGRPETLVATIHYEVLKDGQVRILGVDAHGTGVAGESQKTFMSVVRAWGGDSRNRLAEQKSPLPSNTKLSSIRRTFVFSLNTNDPPIKLGGPPREVDPAPAMPRRHR